MGAVQRGVERMATYSRIAVIMTTTRPMWKSGEGTRLTESASMRKPCRAIVALWERFSLLIMIPFGVPVVPEL